MKKSAHIKTHIHLKNKTKAVKDTKHNISIKRLNYLVLFVILNRVYMYLYL